MYSMATKDTYSYHCTVDTTEIFQVQIGSKFENVYAVLTPPNVITDRHAIIYHCSVYKGICEFRWLIQNTLNWS